MKLIKLTKSKQAIVDDEDYDWLQEWKWTINSTGYAIRKVPEGKSIRMHRAIMKPEDGLCVDHINHNRLDNRRSNLRICTQQQNLFNLRKYSNNTSGYKGVYFHTKSQRYRAAMTLNGKKYHIGVFDDPLEAAKAYEARAAIIHGEFACLSLEGDL